MLPRPNYKIKKFERHGNNSRTRQRIRRKSREKIFLKNIQIFIASFDITELIKKKKKQLQKIKIGFS